MPCQSVPVVEMIKTKIEEHELPGYDRTLHHRRVLRPSEVDKFHLFNQSQQRYRRNVPNDDAGREVAQYN